MGIPLMLNRRDLMATLAMSVVPVGAKASTEEDIFHVAIFRFSQENLDGAMTAFRSIAKATREEEGNISYQIYRGIEDESEFYIVEHWSSKAALASHEASEAFVHYGQGILTKLAILHDTVTARPFT